MEIMSEPQHHRECAEVWERMDGLPFPLHGSKWKGENGVSDCGSHKSCRYRP